MEKERCLLRCGFWLRVVLCCCFMVEADELELENIRLLLSLTFVSSYGLIPTNCGFFL